MSEWRNWGRNVSATPARVEHVGSVQGIADAVGRAAAAGLRVRVAGSGHSFTPLVATDGLLLLKLHPFTAASVGEQVAEFDNIAEWPAGLDLYPVLDTVDCLVTDYSSLLYDHIAVAGSGVVVYAYDYERYVSTDRDLAFPLADNVIGRRADTFAELLEVLRSGEALAELPADRLATLRERFWGTTGPVRRPASPAVADAVAGPAPTG